MNGSFTQPALPGVPPSDLRMAASMLLRDDVSIQRRRHGVIRLMEMAGWRREEASEWLRTRTQLPADQVYRALLGNGGLTETLTLRQLGVNVEEAVIYLSHGFTAEQVGWWKDAGFTFRDFAEVHRFHRVLGLEPAPMDPALFSWARLGLDLETIAVLIAVGSAPDDACFADRQALESQLRAAELLFSMRTWQPSQLRARFHIDTTAEPARPSLGLTLGGLPGFLFLYMVNVLAA